MLAVVTAPSQTGEGELKMQLWRIEVEGAKKSRL